MDYKLKYEEIPKGFKHEVTDELEYARKIISLWKNDKEVSPEARIKIHRAIIKVWVWHDKADNMTVDLGEGITVSDYTGTISYSDLMNFKIKIEGCIHDVNDIYTIIGSAKECVENLWDKEPYKTQLLIAKWILR